MNSSAVIEQHYLDGIARRRANLVGGKLPWLSEQRDSAARTFEALAFPDRRMEAWRYTALDKLLSGRFEPVAIPPVDRQTPDIAPLLLPDLQALRLVFVNGQFAPRLSELDDLPPGVVITSLNRAIMHHPELVAPWLGMTARLDSHRFTAMNGTEINDGLFICIPDFHQLERPVEVLYITPQQQQAIVAQPRNLVVIGQGASASLIERYAGVGEGYYFNNGLSEIILEKDARLDHVRMQQESPDACHLHSYFVAQGAGSRYNSTGFELGGGWSRNEIDVRYSAAGARSDLAGLYSVGSKQLTDVHLNIDHAVPGCISRSDYRGLLHGKGRAVFDGRILVGAQAQQTEAHLNNANLLLARDAEVDTKPQLEIHADNVKCSHGTTVGQLEEAQLFYLRSRGIDALQAKRMLCLGFAGEILERCSAEPLREAVSNALDGLLAAHDLVQLEPGAA